MNTSAGKKWLGALAVLVAAVLALAGCSGDDADDAAPAATTESAPGKAGGGPFFGECGGVSVEDVARVSKIPGLTNTVNNPSVCEWVTAQEQLGPQLSFNWYRGSPIGRERATIQLSRDSVEDVTIDGHSGFIGSSEGICEIGIAFGADFFEWSVSYGLAVEGVPTPSVAEICATAKTLATQSIANAK
ncbi:DUF3558 domain-containing protein [Williamsia sp. 1138]|uniref:DUF3558 domain-containing protein n=1 Tax=Williamsia sp. 1138 TaxID=1903117 RepID=UPI001FEE23BF|nr:DUF3558 domain-containing protein [Williamsia sp. 1138]